MEIKRKFEMTVETRRRIIICRPSMASGQTICAKCGEAMLTAEQTASYFGIKQRRIFRIIEAGAAHYTETEAGTMLVCLPSLSVILDLTGI